MFATQQTFDTLSMARAYLAAGLSVIPIAHGTKEPDTALLPKVHDAATDRLKPSWKPYQERRAREEEIQRWFGRTTAGIAIVGGAVSGGLLILDIESRAAFETWQEHATDLLGADLVARLPVVATGKGCHVYCRCATPGGNRKLAVASKVVLAETRGEGGYVLAPPTVHPSGSAYTLISGDLAAIPALTDGEALALLDAARALAPAEPLPLPAPTGDGAPREDVIGAFNTAHRVETILETHGYRQERPGRYIRPGGERSSLVVYPDGTCRPFNTNDPLYRSSPGGQSYQHTAFSAWCSLEHNGDVTVAVRAAAALLGLQRAPGDTQLLEQAGRLVGLGATSPATSAPTSDPWPYFTHDGGMWMHRAGSDGTPQTPQVLCNFTAQITAETLLDDGEHQEERYTITATCGNRTRAIEMSRTDFEGEGAVGRIVAALGARARVNPKAQPRYVLDAIKAFSAQVDERTLHTHTGWVAGPRFLLGNGYVDAGGWHESDGCTLPTRLHQYRLTPPQAPLSEALALFDTLMDTAPGSVLFPLLAGVLLGPIAHTFNAPAPMVHLYGPTGSLKTSLICAVMAFFGEFVPAQPTDSWTSTANSIQRLGWHLQHCPMVLDDYKAANVKAQHVTFLLQNYGDRMARGRLDANSEARAAYPIRAVLLSSGEDQPEGESSALARILSVAIERKAVHRGHLTSVQKGARRLQLLLIDYLTWLAGQPAALAGNAELHETGRAAILARLEGALEHASNPGRVASNIAALGVAANSFAVYLAERGHWSHERAFGWLAEGKRHLYNLARTQIELTTQERYSQTFLDALRGIIASGRGVLTDLDAGTGADLGPGQVLLGGVDRAGVYVMADVAYDEVCKVARSAGRQVTYSKRALSQMFDQEGLLVSTQPPTKVIRRRINGVPAWCWHLPGGLVLE